MNLLISIMVFIDIIMIFTAAGIKEGGGKEGKPQPLAWLKVASQLTSGLQPLGTLFNWNTQLIRQPQVPELLKNLSGLKLSG